MPTTSTPVVSREERAESLAALLSAKVTRRGRNLAALSLVSPVLVMFLRHSGCTFCREALADLAECRKAIEATGTTIVLVHPGEVSAFEQLLEQQGLADLDRINDENQSLYAAFGLRQGTWWQLASPAVWWRAFSAGVLAGHGAGRPNGDVKQMPGIFLLHRCEVVRSFRHRKASDRPLYESFVRAGLSSAWRKATA